MSHITPNLLNFGDPNNHRGSIGHVMYNYITALIIANKFKLEFVHQEFSGDCTRFENVFKFKNKFPTFKPSKYSNIIKLPYLDFGHMNNEKSPIIYEKSIKTLTEYIKLNSNSNNIFITSNPANQFPGYLLKEAEFLTEIISDSYWSVNSNINKNYNSKFTNVAIHIRRGDINKKDNSDRWKANNHYVEIIKEIKSKIPNSKFFIISEGEINDFKEFDEDINLLLNGSDIEAFHNLACADILVTGQSTFSTIVSFINRGKIIYTPCLSLALFEKYSDRFIHYKEIKDKL